MRVGLLGKKLGMTHVYDKETGQAISVTVVGVGGNTYLQTKTTEKEGYASVQVAFDDQKESRVTKPRLGHFKKHASAPKKITREFRLESDEEATQAQEKGCRGVHTFQPGQYIDVVGKSKGKGFQGVYKRYGFGGLPASHGSMMHRRPGGIGGGTTPGRVWKNTKMPGRHGNYRRTVQNLKIVAIREEEEVLLVSGAIPGAKGGYVLLRPAKKKPLPEPLPEVEETPKAAEEVKEQEQTEGKEETSAKK